MLVIDTNPNTNPTFAPVPNPTPSPNPSPNPNLNPNPNQVMLVIDNISHTGKLVLALPLALLGVHALTLKVNDLNSVIQKRVRLFPQLRVSFLRAWADYFRIPLVKRANYIVCDVLFLVLQLVVFFQRLCGAINASHRLLFVWAASKLLAEIQQYAYNPTVYWRDSSNLLEIVACVFALFACVLRYSLAGHFSFGASWVGAASDSFDWLGKLHPHTQPSGWMYVAPDRPFYVEEQECEWSVELEALRLFAATSCMVATFHLLEMFKLDHDTGVLIIIARRMVEDLVVWLKPVLFVMLAFAFAFHLLSPNYRNADTLENHAPPFRPIPGLSLDFSSSGTPTATQPQGVIPTSTPPSAPTPNPRPGTSQ